MAPQESLSYFLQRAKAVFQSALFDRIVEAPITLVTGNQSADLDSMSSAILYAYFASRDSTTNSTASNETIAIPVLSIPRQDLSIRPEFDVAFRNAGINPQDLITLSDFPYPLSESHSKLPPECTTWILVDHNKLEGELAEAYSSRVAGVIDHHEDERAISTQATPRRIQVCGSCTSLIVDHFQHTWESLITKTGDAETNAEIAKLALGSILVDTHRLKNDRKTVEVDETSAKLCVNVIRSAPGEEGFKKKLFTNELEEAKADVSSLPLDGVLRKDFKAWTEADLKLGMSSVVTTLAYLRDKANDSQSAARQEWQNSWAAAQQKFMEARGLDIHGILAPFVEERNGEKGGKGLLIRWKGEKAKEAVERFEKMAKDELKLQRTEVQGMEQTKVHTLIWIQGDRGKTRKQVGPLLRSAMRDE